MADQIYIPNPPIHELLEEQAAIDAELRQTKGTLFGPSMTQFNALQTRVDDLEAAAP